RRSRECRAAWRRRTCAGSLSPGTRGFSWFVVECRVGELSRRPPHPRIDGGQAGKHTPVSEAPCCDARIARLMKYVLALDQGTTSSRAIVFDERGRPRATAQREFR